MKRKSTKRKPNPEQADSVNPHWTRTTWARARPAKAVLPEILPKEVATRLLKPRGRPKSASPKRLVSLRLSPEVISHFKSQGAGWQTKIDETLMKVVGIKRLD